MDGSATDQSLRESLGQDCFQAEALAQHAHEDMKAYAKAFAALQLSRQA
jgi:hypothetical protein